RLASTMVLEMAPQVEPPVLLPPTDTSEPSTVLRSLAEVAPEPATALPGCESTTAAVQPLLALAHQLASEPSEALPVETAAAQPELEQAAIPPSESEQREPVAAAPLVPIFSPVEKPPAVLDLDDTQPILLTWEDLQKLRAIPLDEPVGHAGTLVRQESVRQEAVRQETDSSQPAAPEPPPAAAPPADD